MRSRLIAYAKRKAIGMSNKNNGQDQGTIRDTHAADAALARLSRAQPDRHRILARIEIECQPCAGRTTAGCRSRYKDFKRYGIHHHAIGPGLRELEALGFIEIVQRGLAGNADHRRPHMFRLTYQPTDHEPATDEWQQIKNRERRAEIATLGLRTNAPPRRPVSQCRKTPKPKPETGTGKPSFSVPETGTKEPNSKKTTPVPETGTEGAEIPSAGNGH